MIFIGSAGSRMFLICARISTDFCGDLFARAPPAPP